jgi:hypothetical protein
MPLKINIGVAQKLGTANYGSISASCAVECEAEAGLLQGDLQGFQNYVARVYAACREAVTRELARQQQANSSISSSGSDNGGQARPVNGQRDGGGPHPAAQAGCHAASEKQLAYARQLAGQIKGLGVRRLDDLANQMFGKPFPALTTLDASALIDTLKGIKAGQLDLDAVLSKEAQ